jgi:hypothetical protein
VKRECYSLGCWKGQTEETLGVGRGRPPKLLWINAANRGDFRESVRDPGRLVPLPPIRHRREVGGIRFNQESIRRNHPNEIVVRPLLERHDAAEGHVPTGGDRKLRQGLRTCVAMQDSDDSGTTCVADYGSRIILGVTSMDDHRTLRFVSERNLRREGGTLRVARRVVVMVVEAALAYCDRAAPKKAAQLRNVALSVERRGIVWVDARGRENEAGVFHGELSGNRGGIDGLADADDRDRARIAGAGDYRVAVAGERCVREVGVAVDEACRAPVLRGHLRSIQRRTGAAT